MMYSFVEGEKNFILLLTIFSPLISLVTLFFINESKLHLIKLVSFLGSIFCFIFSLMLWLSFDVFNHSFQFTFYYSWIDFYNINYSLGVDGISLLFIILTTFLIPLCILASWNNIQYHLKSYLICLLLTEFLILHIFCCLDLFFFYIFFESVLIPMFLLIGLWGSRERKIHAAYQFFLYTLLGSVFMLIGLLVIYLHVGTTDIQVLLNSKFSENRQILLWLSFFISFAVKVPMFPVHIWLPEAHVEAPTAGSVLLAGVLLKLGTYGVFRFLIPIFSYGSLFFVPLVYCLAVIGVIYSSCTTIRQIDLKKIIAYSSVVHMNFLLIGLLTFNLNSLGGSLFLMLSHGIVSGGLFLCVGVLYDRYHTRLLKYYSGLTVFMPLFSVTFLILTLGNIGFPGTSSFIGEFLVILGVISYNSWVTFFGATSMVLGAVYAIWLYNRVMFGPISNLYIRFYSDLNKREFFMFVPLVFLVLSSGVYSKGYFNVFNLSLYNLIEYMS